MQCISPPPATKRGTARRHAGTFSLVARCWSAARPWNWPGMVFPGRDTMGGGGLTQVRGATIAGALDDGRGRAGATKEFI